MCFNEYCRRVPGSVVHAGSLGVLIGEYDKPGYKLRKRAHIGGFRAFIWDNTLLMRAFILPGNLSCLYDIWHTV